MEFNYVPREKAALFIVISIMLFGCSKEVTKEKLDCQFIYNKEAIDKIVIPAFTKTFGGVYNGLDLANPIRTDVGGSVELMFSFKDKDLLDPPYFIMNIDKCRRVVTEMHSTSPINKIEK